jgi:hypothetical protein
MTSKNAKKLTLTEWLRETAKTAPKRVAVWLRKLADGDSARGRKTDQTGKGDRE